MLLDVRLAEGERAGIEGIPVFARGGASARMLVTSVSADDDTVLAAVKAGADGYVWKNETAERVATAVSRGRGSLRALALHRRSPAQHHRALGAYATEVVPHTRLRGPDRERRKTLYLFCVAGLSAKEIADELQVSVNTVHARIKAAYAAIGATSRSDAFRRLVEGVGS